MTTVPRKDKKSEFQSDLYPDSIAASPAIDADKWVAGENATPKLVKLYPSSGSYNASAAPAVVTATVKSPSAGVASKSPTSGGAATAASAPRPTSGTWNKGATGTVLGSSVKKEEEKVLTKEEQHAADLAASEAERARLSAKFGSYIGEKIKFKHAAGEGTKKFHAWYNAHPEVGGATDSDGVAVSMTHFAIPYKGAGGAVLVHPINEPAKLLPGENVIRGHKSFVLDLAFSPFNDRLLYTASDDSDVKVWKIPEGKLSADMKPEDAATVLDGHKSSVRAVVPHPCADGVILTGSIDGTVKLWDVEGGKEKYSYTNIWKDTFYNFSFKGDGAQVAVISRDQNMTVFDPRSGSIISSVSAHEGAKSQRVVWCGDSNYIITVGSDKRSVREVYLWDSRNLAGGKISSASFGTGAGALIPIYDSDTNTLLVGSKGDLSIKLYEMHAAEGSDAASIHFCNDWTATDKQCEPKPLLGLGVYPKRACNFANVEFTRLMRLTTETIDPISFRVPRAADLMEYYQDDIYGPVLTGEPALTAAEWFGGATKLPPRKSMCPAGKKLLSEKPPEEVKISKSREVLKSIKKGDELAAKKADVLNNFTKMAIAREEFHPNLSKGDKRDGAEKEVADDEWE